MSRIRNASGLAYSLWQRTVPQQVLEKMRRDNRPAQPSTEAEIARESRQIYYGQLLHDGHDEQTAYELTVQHFAIADHRAIGAQRNEE